ncbi:Oidioi.mRNA.OKI2018_I69.chr2.g7759.t1.cds [Oikopleura dioica]|uniref:Oidioi.mRNA.OKI2018_I69.chr2.g7759.t1.cds n=1 Tax=Oikopleura dioica TaxID=34765 RepID=A0ABN7T7U4_OIKDI|nr:Oidioi.mRNA.OKI2018_I69.chr2.g7759.t1.cds [Oikopleura dioica]
MIFYKLCVLLFSVEASRSRSKRRSSRRIRSTSFDPELQLSRELKNSLTIFLDREYELGTIKTKPSSDEFDWRSINSLKEFLSEKGRLPVNDLFNSLMIGTLQNFMYDLRIYPDAKPCGIFGTNTRESLQRFLMMQDSARKSKHRVTPGSRFGYNSIGLLQDFLKDEGYLSPSSVSGGWSSAVIKAFRQFLHDQDARVAFTRDFNDKYNSKPGRWGYKTTIVLQQLLIDNGYRVKHLDGRMNKSIIRSLEQFLEQKNKVKQH